MTSYGYTPVFADMVIKSSIWSCDDKTRILWVTILALTDKNSNVNITIPALANLARLSIDDTLKSIETLCSPDPYSASSEHEGRRLIPIEGGWSVVNHAKYREKARKMARAASNAKSQQAWRNKLMKGHETQPERDFRKAYEEGNEQEMDRLTKTEV